jgi:hypothetical protein
VGDDFDVRVFEATGLFLDDVIALGREQERLRAERFQAAGYCCEAGAVGSPEPCPWHREDVA